MLYVFQVETGTHINFDMNMALESVAQLSEAIEREHGIPVGQQVLLANGGECLEPTTRVCTYQAGTDTSPIFLFSKASIEAQQPPNPTTDYGPDVNLQPQIEASLKLPATYQTVVTRAQLSKDCYALAHEQYRICERLVKDQHQQQQGWSAVIANLDDITNMFRSRADILEQSFTQYLAERQQHIELLATFNEDLAMLSKIPILPALKAYAEGLLSPEDDKDSDSSSKNNPQEVLNLLKWVSAKDNQSSLEQVAEQCSRGLEQFDEKVMDSLKAEVSSALESASKPDMKDIKGLGERLYALGTLLVEAKRLVQEHGDLAQAFLQNQNRASNLGDASILPDLCASHTSQIVGMLASQDRLREIRRRCIKAKEELSDNIYRRLKWIMYVENKMMEVDHRLVMYHESLKRLRRHQEILQQIHIAPQMYLSAVAEVVRRRTFSQAFLAWASNLACQLLTVHNEELARRRDFQEQFEGHFLNSLFPGLEDIPPAFATQAPTVFDAALPKLTSEDMESLRETFPELALIVSSPDLNSIPQFFLSRSLTEGSGDVSKDKEAQDEAKVSEPRRAPHLSDRGGIESETDTEEFEKIGQGPADMKPGNSFDSESRDPPKVDKQSEVCPSQTVASWSSSERDLANNSPAQLSPDQCFNNSHSLNHSKAKSLLSPLAEGAEDGAADYSDIEGGLENHCDPIHIPNQVDRIPSKNSFLPIDNPAVCGGGQPQTSASPGSSPASIDNGIANDFMGTEFYMDESLPSSLSEHHADVHQQAIVSLLQENLGNTREEVERLRSLLRSMKTVAADASIAFRQELASIKEQACEEQCGFTELITSVKTALDQHSAECERTLREREQALIVDHELELGELKKLAEERAEEIRSLKQIIQDKEAENCEHKALFGIFKQKLVDDESEFSALRSRIIMMEEALERSHLEKEIAIKETQDASQAEIARLTHSLEVREGEIRDLREALEAARDMRDEAMKNAADICAKYKTELDTARGRFKLMAASSMERSPSDLSLEKIERPDVIELVNHEAIVAQMREDIRNEQSLAIRAAIEKERSECAAKLDHELRLAKQRNEAERQVWFNETMRRIIEEKDREVESHRSTVAQLSEECERCKETIRRLTDSETKMRQTLDEMVDSCRADLRVLKYRESQLYQVKPESSKLRGLEDMIKLLESKNELLESAKASLDCRFSKLEAEKEKLKAELDIHRKNDEAEVSESKKVRLESDPEVQELVRRIGLLETENKRIGSDLRLFKDAKDVLQSKLEVLESEKVSLEVELVQERSRRGFASENVTVPIAPENKEKDMMASVAVVSDSSSRDAATSPEPTRKDPTSHIKDKLTRSTTNLIQQAQISLTSCNPGDVNLVVWDPQHMNYVLLQDSATLYFLHSDCVDSFDLKPSQDGTPKKHYATVEVIDKEYCVAKKPENRYRVPLGTKFYRVRVKPQQKDSSQMATSSKGGSSQHQQSPQVPPH